MNQRGHTAQNSSPSVARTDAPAKAVAAGTRRTANSRKTAKSRGVSKRKGLTIKRRSKTAAPSAFAASIEMFTTPSHNGKSGSCRPSSRTATTLRMKSHHWSGRLLKRVHNSTEAGNQSGEYARGPKEIAKRKARK